MYNKIITFLNKPLPDNVCWAVGLIPPCCVNWNWVIIVVAVISFVWMW